MFIVICYSTFFVNSQFIWTASFSMTWHWYKQLLRFCLDQFNIDLDDENCLIFEVCYTIFLYVYIHFSYKSQQKVTKCCLLF